MFLVGLAGVFLANAVVALLDPDEFTKLVARSELGQLLRLDRAGWIAPAIVVNDTALGLALLAAIRLPRTRAAILAWSGTWLLGVTIVKLTALGSA